jgi:Zn finger protein HypA/HybF involved in hydrogenase expression
MTSNEILDQIKEVRTRNNENWMALTKLAFEVAPDRAKEIMGRITKADTEITALCKQLVDDECPYCSGPQMKVQNDEYIKTIPMSRLLPFSNQAIVNHGQTLKKLNERGGLSLHEAYAICSKTGYRNIKHADVEYIRAYFKCLKCQKEE